MISRFVSHPSGMRINPAFPRIPAEHQQPAVLSRPPMLNSDIVRSVPSEENKLTRPFKGKDHIADLTIWSTGNTDLGRITSEDMFCSLGRVLKSAGFGSLRSSALCVWENNETKRGLFMEASERPGGDKGRCIFDLSIWPETNTATPIIKGMVEFFRL